MAKRILVVDDEACVLFVVQRALAGLGGNYEVLTAGSGSEALDQLGGGEFDLVITDIRMPGMDGIRLTEEIRGLNSGAVVMWMTAFGYSDIEWAARRLGVRACLHKPLEVAEIRALALAALEETEVGAAGHRSDAAGNGAAARGAVPQADG